MTSHFASSIFRCMAKYEDVIRDVSQVGLAVSDRSRLRLMMALQGRSLCVCQLTELLSLAPSTVSKHLSVLKQAGLLTEKKVGRWVYHELCDGDCSCAPVVDWVRRELAMDQQIAQDKIRLKEILAMELTEICRK